MRIARIVWCIVLLTVSVKTYAAQTASPLPAEMVIDQRLNYDQHRSLVIPCIEWLQRTPLTEDKNERRRVDNFIMYWLQKTTDVIVTMPDYLVKFQSINNEFYFLYTGGWIKYALQTHDTNRVNCFLAGVNSMLDYYEAGMGVKRHAYLDKLVAVRKNNKLRDLYNSQDIASNTLLYLEPVGKKTNYNADENYFNFRFTAINFLDPKSLVCRYKLEGYYDDWVPTNDEFAIFPKLPPGNYKFRIQASMFPDFSKAVEQSYAFTIISPLWQRPWFITLAVFSVAAIAYVYARQREKHLKNMALLQQQKMLFEYDHLRSQVNPHFLFNSLNTLTGLIEEEPKKALEYSSHLSDLYRTILTYRSEDQLYLFEELDILNNYIHIQKSRFGNALQVSINIPKDTQENRKVVPLALQLLVENAMKHNVVSASHPLVISITADDRYITISNNVQLKLSKEKGLGIGLENISKRYALATKEKISFGEQEGHYVVRLPLL
ncbi:MAG: hypothetical protein K0R82_2709 [Flavipsychrobacter sp.]|nr:hypothetical protein [Flavipsychrobacter sp.]